MSYVTISAESLESLLRETSLSRLSSPTSWRDQPLSPSSPNSIIFEAQSYDEALGGLSILKEDTASHTWPLFDWSQFRWDASLPMPSRPSPPSQLTNDLHLKTFYTPLYDTVVQQGPALQQTPSEPPAPTLAANKKEDPHIRRRMQNRQSQRAFRDRKEKHLKELEDTVASMANIRNALEAENGWLKDQLKMMSEEGGELVKMSGMRPFHVEEVKSLA